MALRLLQLQVVRMKINLEHNLAKDFRWTHCRDIVQCARYAAEISEKRCMSASSCSGVEEAAALFVVAQGQGVDSLQLGKLASSITCVALPM
jgi:hypothetical protein